MRLNGKVAIVTGASRGIGRSVALRFAAEGAQVVGTARDATLLESLAEEIRSAGGVCEMVTGSVALREDVVHTIETAMRTFGRIDLLVNNAGFSKSVPFLELTDADWYSILDTNLKGMFLYTQVVAREMAKTGGGRIINMASIRSYRVAPDDLNVLYDVTKGGIIQLTRSTAIALLPHNILVNGIAPGWIYTDMTRKSVDHELNEVLKQIPIGHVAQPDDVAELAVLLATENTRYLVGQVILLDGGQSLLL